MSILSFFRNWKKRFIGLSLIFKKVMISKFFYYKKKKLYDLNVTSGFPKILRNKLNIKNYQKFCLQK